MDEKEKSRVVSETLNKANNKTKKDLQSEKSTKSTHGEPKISICDVMKNNTSKVIKKMEYQIPSTVQQYSDLYTEYLHMYDDLFGTCYISEKNFFDKLGIDQKLLQTFDNYSNTITKFYLSQWDIANNLLNAYIPLRILTIQSFDRYMHVLMDSYAESLSNYNNALEKNPRKTNGEKYE